MDGMPFYGVFLRYPSPYLREFRRKIRKTQNGSVDKRDRGLNLALPVYQFRAQNRTATGGAKDGQFNMLYPGFEHGSFGAAAGFPSQCTA